MTAGPYPTKVMFEGLKERVDKTENAPALDRLNGVGATAALNSGVSPDISVEGDTLVFSWQRRSVSVGGFSIRGRHSISLLQSVEISTEEGASGGIVFQVYQITCRTFSDGGQAIRTYFDFPELAPITDGVVRVNFTAPVAISGYSDLALPTATGLLMRQYGTDQLGVPDAYLTTRRTLELPIRPEYVARLPEDRQARRAEIIWPESGPPHLLVIGVDGNTFHLPLTPGLPK